MRSAARRREQSLSDVRIRELERRWAETRAGEDERALVRARLQVGLVSAEALALAAYCGSPLARELHADPPQERPSVQSWGAGLLRWGRQVPVRAALSVLTPVFAGLAEREPTRVVPDNLVEGSIRPRALRTLRAIETWVVDPTPLTRKQVSHTAKGLQRSTARLAEALHTTRQAAFRDGEQGMTRPWRLLTDRERQVGSGAFALRACLAAVTSNATQEFEAAAGKLVSRAVFAADGLDTQAGRRLAAQEVVAWALGHGDPVQARVATYSA